MSSVVEQIALYQRKVEKYAKSRETDKLLYYIHKLKYLDVTVSHLEETGVGRTVNALRHYEGLVGEKARALVNKWKVMVTAEEEEEEEGDIEEEDERQQASPVGPRRGEERHNTEEQESEGGDDKEEGQLQIEEDDEVEYEDEGHGYGYGHQDSPAEDKIGIGYGNHQEDSASGGEESDGYNPVTSQRDYQLHSKGAAVAAAYHPSRSTIDHGDVSSPSWKDSSPDGSSDRKNGSSTKSSSKKSHREDKEKYKERERHKDREKDKHKDSLGNQDKEKRKDHKEKRKDKHRDREEKREEKEKVKSHKDKHKDRDKHNGKPKEHKFKGEEYNEKSKAEKELEKDVVNGFSTPELEKRPHDGRQDSRESDKRHVVEKRKDRIDKSSSSHRKEDSSSKDRNSIHKENRLNESVREIESISKESIREKDIIKEKERRKEEKHKDKNRDSSSSGSSKKEKNKKESETKKNQREQEDSENDKKENKKKKNKKNVADDNIGFGAALMGFDSPVKRKKKKKKKDLEKERESSDDEQPSTSKSPNKRIHADGGGLPDPKKPKILAESPQKLPHLPPSFGGSFIADDGPLLPEITPNYKPLPRVPIRDEPADHMMSRMTEEEALNIMFQSKNNRRSKVYSGKVSGLSYVPSLYESCIRVLQENIDALEYTGGIPFEILRPVLDRASPQQLINLEDFNSYLLEDTNVIWEVHCKRDFRNKKLEEMETWRDMWIRCFDEREQKLRNVTQNLQQKFISKAEPKRTTKLAFVGTTVKVPRNVARAQAKYGTAAPSAAAAKSGKASDKANEVAARKTAMQNAQRAERAINNPRPVSAKNKKVAPLMAKTRQLFKQAFRR